jgi:flagellar motor switch protein FliM
VEVLSQSEIDELLSALTAGVDVPEAEQSAEDESVREYNFRTANKFPKEQIKTLSIIFETFTHLLANHLTGLLRTHCDISLVSIEEQTFGEYSNSMPETAVLGIMNMNPMFGSSLIVLTPAIAYSFITRLFGGEGGSADAEKPFSELEISITERILRQVMPLISQAWERITAVKASLDRIETSPQFAQIVAMNEPIAIVTLELISDDVTDMITICIPHVAVQPIAKQMNTKLWFSSEVPDSMKQSYYDVIQEQLVNTPINMQVSFDETMAPASEIMRLQPGDVIRLDHHVSNYITVKVEHIPKFKALIGTSGANMVVQIVDIIRGDSDYE